MHQRQYEEKRLFLEYQRTGSSRDRDALIERFLPLARSLARRQRRGGEPLEDLEQVAFLALVKAVDAFDPSRGTAFSSFAVPSISGAMKRHFRDVGWAVRVPRALQELALEVDHVNEELTAAGSPATPAQIAAHIGAPVEDVLEARAAYHALRADSLDRPRFAAEEPDALIDTLGAEDEELRHAFERIAVEELIETLDPRAQQIMRLYYQEELTQAEIGERLGYSQMHISRLLRRAGEKLLTAAPELAEVSLTSRGETCL